MSQTSIKILAVILMLIDHIGQFFPSTPLLLRQIGRVSAPLFIFTAAIGFYHTRSKIGYLKNLYLFSVIMSITSAILNSLFINPNNVYITNNIFSTLFLIDIIVYIIESTKNNKPKRNLYIFYFLIYNVLSFIIYNSFLLNESISVRGLIGIIPNIFHTEGGILIVLYGVYTYLFKSSKKNLIILNIIIAIFIIFSGELSINYIVNINFQWMMIFSLPIIFMYNKKKGKGYKTFFYLFYPIHITALFILSSII